jgi:5-methylcytosine-specific restriction endonuclease McrA
MFRGEAKRGGTDMVIVADRAALERGHADEGEVCHIIGGGPIPVRQALRLATDAFIKAVIHDGVQVETIKHYGRHINAELRTVLGIGDPPSFAGPVCVDCGAHFRLEIDHVDPVANGGPTCATNLEPRCPPCHAAKTERDRLAGLLGKKEQQRDGPRTGRSARERDGPAP